MGNDYFPDLSEELDSSVKAILRSNSSIVELLSGSQRRLKEGEVGVLIRAFDRLNSEQQTQVGERYHQIVEDREQCRIQGVSFGSLRSMLPRQHKGVDTMLAVATKDYLLSLQ